MTVMVGEVYTALRSVGVEETQARAAAQAVIGMEALTDLATKADVAELRAATKADLAELRALMKADLLDMKADLLKWHVGTLLAITAIYGGLVSLLKLFG
jgi:hypothetical protein